MKKSLFLFLAILILPLIAFFLIQKKQGWDPMKPTGTLPATNSPLPKAPTQSLQIKNNPPEPIPAGVNPQFVQYLRSEAQRMNAPSVDQEKTQKEIEAQAALMTPIEMDYAKKTALSDARPANERIFAVYMLMNAKGSEKTLEEFILSPLKYKTPPPADTLEETESMQEKSYKGMAIDSLLQRARKDPAARASLARIASEIQDANLRAYIVKKLKELPPI